MGDVVWETACSTGNETVDVLAGVELEAPWGSPELGTD